MKDIDFDELDRAVSSLMGPAVQSEKSKAPDDAEEAQQEEQEEYTDTVPVLDLDAAAISSEDDLLQAHEPEEPKEESAPEPEEEPTRHSKETLAPTARRGRFMDVMRPAAQGTKRPGLSTAPSRQGVTLQPLTANVQPEEETETSSEVSDEEVNQDKDIPTDMNSFGFSMDMEPETKGDSPDEEPADELPPLSSPFLPDAKVEKRPLGRPAEVASDSGQMDESTDLVPELVTESFGAIDPISSDKDAQLPEQPLPPELNSELLSIETGGDNLPPETPPAASPEVVDSPAVSKEEPAAPAPSPASAMMAASIPQQYKIEPKQDDDAPASAIYDTQPLAHPAEKTPGWVWIAGIIAVLLLGVGGGAAIYYLGLL